MLDPSEEIVTVTELREQFAATLERARATGRPVIVTQDGAAAVVLVEAGRYGRAQGELAVLRAILAGERDVRAGRIVSHDDVETRLGALARG